MARHETIRMLVAKVAAQVLIFEGLDIASAYLYGKMDVKVRIEQPTDSSGNVEKPRYNVLLNKSLYGGNQCGAIWGTLFHREATS